MAAPKKDIKLIERALTLYCTGRFGSRNEARKAAIEERKREEEKKREREAQSYSSFDVNYEDPINFTSNI